MGYLGLDQTEVKDDNLFQRLFWPSDHAGEADTLGQQGFWVCFGVAVFSCLVLCAQGHFVTGLLTLLFYGLGGIGVREHSQIAAVLVAIVYLLNGVANVFLGIPPGILQFIAVGLLLANIRGTWIAAKWAEADGGELPDRRNESFSDQLVDQMPRRLWPIGQYVFYGVSGIYVLLTLLGLVMLATHVSVKSQPKEAPSTTLEVSPSR